MTKQLPDSVSNYLSSLGKKGGKSRMSQLSPEERKEMARGGGKARMAQMTPAQRAKLERARLAGIAKKAKKH
jgi:hypothetical protein